MASFLGLPMLILDERWTFLAIKEGKGAQRSWLVYQTLPDPCHQAPELLEHANMSTTVADKPCCTHVILLMQEGQAEAGGFHPPQHLQDRPAQLQRAESAHGRRC